METLPSVLIIITLTFLLAGFVKGIIGLGLPTVSMGLLALVMTPVQAAALLVVPSLVTCQPSLTRAAGASGNLPPF